MSYAKVCAAAVLAVALPLSAQAENQPAPRGPSMMQPGGGNMGQRMPRQGMGPGMGPGMGMGSAMAAPRPFAGVDFSESQRKQIQQMMAQERKMHQQRAEEMQGVQKQLRELYMADKWDTKAITKLYEKLHAEQRKTIAAMAEARNKVYELMSKEQREQMKASQQEQMKRFSQPPQQQPRTPPQQ